MIVLAGINGAGKSTFQSHHLKKLNLPFINADLIAKVFWPDQAESRSYDAAAVAEKLRRQMFERKLSFVTETVFSHPSKLDLLRSASTLGYTTLLIYIHLENPKLAALRVEERVSRGGHSVPGEKIGPRFERLARLLREAIAIANTAVLYDNSSLEQPFLHSATFRQGHLTASRTPLPAWAPT